MLAGALLDLQRVDSVEINDFRNGTNTYAVSKHEHRLNRREKSFAGTTRFGGEKNSKTPREIVEDIEIPLEAIRSFLEKIAAAPVSEGVYNHEMDFIDDFVSISIKLVTSGEPALVLSRLQGVEKNPWRLAFKGKIFVVKSDSPSKALAELEPYLKQKTSPDRTKEFASTAKNLSIMKAAFCNVRSASAATRVAAVMPGWTSMENYRRGQTLEKR